MSKLEWTQEDNHASYREGWALFTMDTGQLRIQMLDTPQEVCDDHDLGKFKGDYFKSDDEAEQFVRVKAAEAWLLQDSNLHNKCLKIMAEHNRHRVFTGYFLIKASIGVPKGSGHSAESAVRLVADEADYKLDYNDEVEVFDTELVDQSHKQSDINLPSGDEDLSCMDHDDRVALIADNLRHKFRDLFQRLRSSGDSTFKVD